MPGGTSCPFKCPPGTYNKTIGAVDDSGCDECPPGYFCPRAGTSIPEGCPAGSYLPTSGSSSSSDCIPCNQNFYSNKIALTIDNCTSCPDDLPLSPVGSSADSFCTAVPVKTCKVNEWIDGNICTACPSTFQCDGNIKVICELGHYCIDGIAKACESGTANALSGQISNISCTNCAAGLYNPLVGQSVCLFTCPSGKYMLPESNGGKDEDSCLQCPSGTFCAQRGTTVPENCPKGIYFVIVCFA